MAILKRPEKSNLTVWPLCRDSRGLFFFLPPRRSLNLSCRFVKHPLKFLSDGTSDNLLSCLTRVGLKAELRHQKSRSSRRHCAVTVAQFRVTGFWVAPCSNFWSFHSLKCGFQLSKCIKWWRVWVFLFFVKPSLQKWATYFQLLLRGVRYETHHPWKQHEIV